MEKRPNIPLSKLPMGISGKVIDITAKGLTRRRMLDLGLINGTNVLAVRKSPSGDPIAYEIRGAIIALRQEEASHILIEQVHRVKEV